MDNTIVFEVDRKFRKNKIKEEVVNVFGVKVEKVRTLIKGNKKLAYIKLDKKNPAIDIATKLGMI